jgi:hypothetical protein
MGLGRTIRSAEFRKAHWERAIDLAGLLEPDAQAQIRANAVKANVGKKRLRRLDSAIASHSGTATLEAVDRTAKRYSLLSVRRKLDWNPKAVLRQAPEGVRVVDRQLCDGIWSLDVTLRKQVEALLTAKTQDPQRARALRYEVEKEAGALAATLDMRERMGGVMSYWDEIAEYFDPVCKELDELLTQAGAPQSEN